MEYRGKEYEELLELKPPWIVEKVIVDSSKKRVDVFISHESTGMKCPICRSDCSVYDHLRERIWRDLNSIDFETFLHTRPPRIRCSEHGVIQVDIPWSEHKSRFTTKFETAAIGVLSSTDVKNASLILSVTWNEAWNIMRKAVQRGLARKESSPKRIGVDEKSYGKHHHYVTVVFNHDNPAVEYVAYERKESSLDLYYESIGDRSKEIEAVSLDMWDPYIASTREHVLDAYAKIVFDRFHIMKHMNGAVDDTRRMESRIADLKDLLKGSRYIWLYSQENLPDKYRERYESLKRSDLKTARAYAIKENLRNLWLCANAEEAQSFWKRWYWWASHSRLDPVIKAAKMIKHYLYGVMSYFTHRITNAIAEGLNSKIATIQKMAYGYRNRENFKTAIYFHCGNLKLYPDTHTNVG